MSCVGMGSKLNGLRVVTRSGLSVVQVVGVALLAVMLSGCYTRQIEGIQKDLDVMDRRLHHIDIKTKEAKGVDDATVQDAVVLLEDRLNEVTLMQGDLAERVSGFQTEIDSLRQDQFVINDGSIGVSLENQTEIEAMQRKVDAQERKADQLSKDVKELKSTFDELKKETRTLITILKEEFSGQSGVTGAESTPAKSVSSGSTNSSKTDQSAAATTTSTASNPTTYMVKAGDTLSGIAQRFNVTVEELKKVNNIQNPRRDLRLATPIRIP